ncbi:Fur family transcriptional regulator [Thermaurantiacus sp.]
MDASLSHQHPHPGAEGLQLAASSTFTGQGIAWTALRAAIFQSLAEAKRPLSAYEVSDAVSQQLGRRIAANSVYRILDLFVAYNLAKRIESRNAYVANIHPECQHDCIFLICSCCGAIDHLDDDQLAKAMRTHATSRGFIASRTVLELEGLCRRCNG